ncbi:MAG: phosphatidate cytidylyltransferase [Pseudolabrys sp.]
MSNDRAAARLGNLATRILSALVLAPIAIAAAYFGGVYFAGFFALAAAAVLWEWAVLTGPARNRWAWMMAGVFYAGVLLLAPSSLRHDAQYGFSAMLFIFAAVWATDIAAYFAGRAFGGPKLAPSISPKKTWSGAFGGTGSAVIVAIVAARYLPESKVLALIGVALVLSVASQVGDLFESALKRHFGAKDAGHLIPGHGGVMDRLDGFWAAALVAALIGIARGGFDATARGLLLW